MYSHTKVHKSVRRYVQSLAAGTAAVALIPQMAMAQGSSTNTAEAQLKLEEVIVTGSLIRGVEATGSQQIGMDPEAIIETGAVTTNEILATIPQVSNFFNQRPEQDPRGADRNQVNRPNLRNLPGVNSTTGHTTLLLVDSHRVAPVGSDQSSPDPDILPGAVIERIEVVTDGGSSMYGADAVGGVINFKTLDEYDGVEIDLGYDAGDDYNAWQASILAGTKWDSGSIYAAFSTTDRDEVLIGDRDWALQGSWDPDGTVLSPVGTQCITPVGAVTNWFWYGAGWTDNPAAPGAGVTPVGEACDIDAQSTLIPKQERDNIYAGLVQEFGDNMSLNVKAYYMDRETSYASYPLGDTIAEPSPAEQGLVGSNVGDLVSTSQVGFSYGAHPAYRNQDMVLDIETWGITPELTIDLASSWQLRATMHYGESENSVIDPLSNRAKMVDYVNSGQVDPLNIAAADTAVLNDILNWQMSDYVEQEMFSARLIGDGDVFELPAGMLKAAIGVEYQRDEASKRFGESNRALDGLETNSDDRDVSSVFAELSIPVFDSFDIAVSARYDDYSDFGDTTNPHIGFSWHPTDWINLYGKWGESFNAPTVLDSLATANGRYIFDAAAGVPDPLGERTNPSRDDVLLLEGASGALLPQTAESWGVGIDMEPLDGLAMNVYYYEIEFMDLLASVNPQLSSAVLLNPDKFIYEPTLDEWNAALAAIGNSDQFATQNPEDVGVIVDRRIANTEEALLKGVDFSIQYFHESGLGSMSYGVSGNYQSTFDLTQSGAVVDQLEYNPDLFLSAFIGWAQDNARARLTFRYTDEFDTDPGIAVNQTTVDDFLTTNLFIGYDFDATSGFLDGLSVRVNVDNLFDEEPPVYRSQRNINFASWTLGRVFKFGVTKRF